MKPAEYARREFNGEWFFHVPTKKYVQSMLLDTSGRAIAWDEEGNEMIINVRDLQPDDRTKETQSLSKKNGISLNPIEPKVQEVKMTYEEKAIKAMELISEGKIEEAIDIFNVTELSRFRSFLHAENQITSSVHMDYSRVKDPNLREFLEKSYIKYMSR